MSDQPHLPILESELPGFENPPVIEVVMGVQFQSLTKLYAPHTGLFWSKVRSTYPICRENPPIIPRIEDFQRPGGLRQTKVGLSALPSLSRVFFERLDGEWLIQLQRDRFLHNWRSRPSTPDYPRYPVVRKEFFEQWDNFQQFVAENELGEINITQLEITYLNHIAVSASDFVDVFSDFGWLTGKRLLGKPESISVSCSFRSPNSSSRLRVEIRPGKHEEKGDILLFELTVRGVQGEQSIKNWFDQGRAWIVNAFADLTNESWHKKWGKTE